MAAGMAAMVALSVPASVIAANTSPVTSCDDIERQLSTPKETLASGGYGDVYFRRLAMRQRYQSKPLLNR
jgi:hypothetical protein